MLFRWISNLPISVADLGMMGWWEAIRLPRSFLHACIRSLFDLIFKRRFQQSCRYPAFLPLSMFWELTWCSFLGSALFGLVRFHEWYFGWNHWLRRRFRLQGIQYYFWWWRWWRCRWRHWIIWEIACRSCSWCSNESGNSAKTKRIIRSVKTPRLRFKYRPTFSCGGSVKKTMNPSITKNKNSIVKMVKICREIVF